MAKREPSTPTTASDPKLGEHRVARQVVNPIQPHPVRVLSEPPLRAGDAFFLEAVSGSATTFKVVNIDGGYVVIEFDNVRDNTFYNLVHVRVSTNGGAPQRDVVLEHINGRNLTLPLWSTPGKPQTTRKGSEAAPVVTAPYTKDPLLQQDVTDFTKVSVEEPTMDGKS
jgi:hypothetical protein